MEFVETNDDIQTIDITSKNKWKWAWVENTALEHVIRKTRRDGLAWCCICKQTLKYGSSGKKALWRHIDTPQHTQAVEYVKKNKRSSRFGLQFFL